MYDDRRPPRRADIPRAGALPRAARPRPSRAPTTVRARVRLLTFFGSLALLALLVVPAAATRSDTPPDPRDKWHELARSIADPWPGLQTRAGWYRDYVYGGGKGFCLTTLCRRNLGNARYGESVMGYGLIMTGLRERDPRLVNSGIRAITYIVRRPDLQRRLPTAFEGMAVAAAYNLLSDRRPANPLFEKGRRSWEKFMRRQPVTSTVFFKPDTTRYGNHFLVEGIEILELLKTGLRSNDPRAILGPDRRYYKRQTMRLINGVVPRLAAETSLKVRSRPAFVHSDPPDNPLAYFGLSTGLYARAVRDLGSDARRSTAAPIERAAYASVWLTAPDGDMGYFGRSLEQSWAYSGLAAGNEAAANQPGTSATDAARYRVVSDRALARLRDVYGSGPKGWWILPALREQPTQLFGIDRYIGAVAFSGLTLVTLNWALDEMERNDTRAVASVPTDRNFAVALGQGDGRFATVRQGDVWFAVRRKRSTKRPNDLRYDFGLIALKVRQGGVWTGVVRARPKTNQAFDSAGPTLVTASQIGLPRGERLRVRRGTVVVAGGYRTPDRKWLRQSVTWTYRAVPCGVKLTFFAIAGEYYQYSVFLRRDAGRPSLRGRTLVGGTSKVLFTYRPVSILRRGGYASGNDASLTRVRLTLFAPKTGPMSITTCRR